MAPLVLMHRVDVYRWKMCASVCQSSVLPSDQLTQRRATVCYSVFFKNLNALVSENKLLKSISMKNFQNRCLISGTLNHVLVCKERRVW